MRRPNDIQIGFSLVELSIVLVILGLLTGGILGGRSLIRAAELRSVTVDYSRYLTSVRAFRDKYFALPGDLTNATKVWGAAHSDPATCRGTASVDSRTCDGDGNQRISALFSNSVEYFRAWQHLANAGLVEGQYAGVFGAFSDGYCERNCPRGKLANTFWEVSWLGPVAVGRSAAMEYSGFFNGQYDNGFVLSQYRFTFSGPIMGGGLLPEEVWNVDSKIDDSMPALGKVVVGIETNPLGGAGGDFTLCTNAAGSFAVQAATMTANYLLTGTEKRCSVVFRQQF